MKYFESCHSLFQVKVKTYFSYDPTTDLLIPCKDAGLAFSSGDILEVLNTDDPIWWQASAFDNHATNKIGLIPSRALQTRSVLTTLVVRGFHIC